MPSPGTPGVVKPGGNLEDPNTHFEMIFWVQEEK